MCQHYHYRASIFISELSEVYISLDLACMYRKANIDDSR